MTSLDEFAHSSTWLIKVSGAQRGRERHAAPAADAHGGRLARAQPPRPTPRPTAMELSDVPRHRPLAFDKMESLIKEMQDPETGVPVRSQKLFLTYIPSAFMGYDLVEWLMDRFNLDEQSNVEAINLANQLCQYGYFFPVNDSKNLVLKDDSSLYRFQSPYYWPWQPPRVGGSAPGLAGSDNVEYAIYLVKRTLRNKQRHGLEDHEVEALANLKKNLAAKWDFITMQAEEQVRLAKDRKKGDKIVSDSQERAYWRVARPPPGQPSVQETCPVPVRSRVPKAKKRTIQQITREIEHLNASLDRTRVKTSIALEALMAYSETFTPYDPWLTPPQPSNPWISDDTLYWQINSPLVEVPSEKRVQRWALSIDELVSDPTGLQEFTSFLRKEYSHENIRFWLAVMDLRRSSVKQISKKLEEIYEEFLKPGAPCEINIDGATMDRVVEDMRTGSRYALDHAAEHVYSLLLKKDCYPRFVRSDHFRRLLEEGKNVHQKKKFFNFGGGQVKKKPGSTSTGGLSRRRGSDRSLSGSAHELAVCAAQPPRLAEPPPHSHSQSNLADIPFRDPLDDDRSDVAPWETSSRESSSYSGARRRQDSAADSGSSSSDVSAAVCGERARRLPQQSTLDGGLRGAPPPLRRLSAVEPRHLAPLASPPRPRPAPAAAPALPPHPTPTISVSSAPDDDSAGEPPDSPDEPRSLAVSDEPSSVFASADATPTEPARPALRTLEDAPELDPATIEEGGPAPKTGCKIGDLPESVPGGPDAESSPARAPAAVPAAASPAPAPTPAPAPAGPTPESPAPLTAAGPAAVVPSSTAAVAPAAPACAAALTAAPSAAEPTAPPPVSLPPSAPAPEPAGSAAPPAARPPETSAAPPAVRPPETTAAPPAVRAPETSAAPPAVRPPESSAVPAAARPPESAGVGAPRSSPSRPPPVAPLAVGEDTGVDDDHVDKVPSAAAPVPTDLAAAAESDATKKIAHEDELSSVSKSNIVKRDNKSDLGDRKQRNDICPWEDENSCESDAPFVKTYATLGYL
ncbi:uncharacterized protein LOC125227975 isoform X2 [Leguminivora glycinivorella]|uniref:uncharacterized protein LOC125227975 isoform X2 n=2 Tax=Leguminivora glycinivorella TaxID=1035111 RepID=UPI00200CB2AD|nr:uncharacterized protein LOC125227975 isoform X2 [Leguminivora glycinivorella]